MSQGFSTSPGCGFAVKFSPKDSTQIAVATGNNFGFKGVGFLWMLRKSHNQILPLSNHIWRDVILDVDWSPSDESILATVSGDGSLTVWDVHPENFTLRVLSSRTEHRLEACSVKWSGDFILTSSWDGTIKLWDIRNEIPLRTYSCCQSHRVNDVSVSKFDQEMFASSSSKGNLCMWDLRTGRLVANCLHNSDILSTTFSNFDPYILIHGSADGRVTIRDIRNVKPIRTSYQCHSHPVKKIVNSYHNPGLVWTASYDFTVKCSDIGQQGACLLSVDHHSEFVTGLDLDYKSQEGFVDCSWDRTVKLGSFSQ